MNRQSLISAVTISMLAVLFAGCSASENQERIKSPVLSAALPAESTPYQQQSYNDTNYVATSDQELGYLAQVPLTQTAAMQAVDDFAFHASDMKVVNFSLPEMSTHPAEATFCTDYTMQASGDYRVDYNSCVLSAPVLGGSLHEKLNLVNQHQSVIGVVSFQDPSIQPIYQEFHFD